MSELPSIKKVFPLYVRLKLYKHKRVGPDKLIDFMKTKQSTMDNTRRSKIRVHAACVDLCIENVVIAEGVSHEKALDAFHALLAGNDEHAYGKLRDKFKLHHPNGDEMMFIELTLGPFFEDIVSGNFECQDYRSPNKRGRG